jgi:hypothetical protein
MSEVIELRDQFLELQRKYQQHLPNVDPALIDNLLLRQMENPGVAPMYMVEVFTKPGLDTQKMRERIIARTGQAPAIYDNGTHYATHHRLTLELLKEISNADGVIEITGEYTGGTGSYAASHEHRSHEDRRKIIATASPSENALQNIVAAPEEESRQKDNYKIAIYTAAGIIGAIALAGFIISGGLLPNSNTGQAIPAGTEPGVLHGYVAGPGGLPAVGATVLAVQQGNDFFASSFVSVNGQYFLNLLPGNYIVVVSYPDGTDKTTALDIERGSSHELNFAY